VEADWESMRLHRSRYNPFAALSMVFLLSACGPTFYEQEAAIRHRPSNQENEIAKQQAAEIERLFQICNADVKRLLGTSETHAFEIVHRTPSRAETRLQAEFSGVGESSLSTRRVRGCKKKSPLGVAASV
jgi:hypothetical protein